MSGRGRGLLRDQTPAVLTSPSESGGPEARVQKPAGQTPLPPPKIIEARITTILDPGNFWTQLGSGEAAEGIFKLCS